MRSSGLILLFLFLGIFHSSLFAANSNPNNISRLFNKYSIICSDSHVIQNIDRKTLFFSNVLREKIIHINDNIFEVSFDSEIIYQILDFMKILERQKALARPALVNLISKQVKNKFADPDDITDLLEAAYFLEIP